MSDAAAGRKLPTLALTLAYVTACGGDPEEWEQRWRAIAAPPDETREAPYVGMKAFQQEDAARFFGREKLTAKLVDLANTRHFVAVVGASGSGKSSLLRAGLAARVNALVFTPGSRPIDECAVRLAQLTGESAVTLRAELEDPSALGLRIRQHDDDLVLVIDQFEEVFTLAAPDQRDWFVSALMKAPRVVIGVRADFYGHIARHPELVEALEGAQLLVGPMSTEELRRAITEPALRVGAVVETALLTRLVADVAGEAAALPLVQHALVETWRRRRGMTLTLAGYEEAGGVEHAIAHTAETLFTGLPEDQQVLARQIFLRLIALGEGTEDTKRRVAREDLDTEVVERLAAARLVTLTDQHVELTHEALIRSWPRLRDWIDENRVALRVHHQLTEAAAGWDGHDPDVLYRGGRLEQAGELDATTLTEPERAFLRASQARARRRARRMRVVVSVLSVLVVLLAGTVVFAVDKAVEVARQQDSLMAKNAVNAARWMITHDPRNALRLALAAYQIAPGEETRDGLLSADAANRTSTRGSGEVHYFLLGDEFVTETPAPDTQRTSLRLWRHSDENEKPYMELPGVALSANRDGKRILMAVGTDLRVRTGIELLDTTDPARPRRLAALSSPLVPLTPLTSAGDVFAGRLAPSQSRDGFDAFEDKARVWFYDGAGGFREVVLPGADITGSMVLSGDGKLLAVFRKSADRTTVELWQIDGVQPRLASSWQVADAARSNRSVFSPDGTRFVLRNAKAGTTEIWDVSDPAKPAMWMELPEPEERLLTFAFSEDGRYLGIAGERAVRVWDVHERGLIRRVATFEGHERQSLGLAYLPSRKEFATVVGGRSIWYLRIDADEVVEDRCRDADLRLSDEEWARYFPGVERDATLC